MAEKDQPKDLLNSEAMHLVQDARGEVPYQGFVPELFLGRVRLDILKNFPEQDLEDKAKAEEFLSELKNFLLQWVDPNTIDRDGRISDELIAECRRRKLFGLKIPKEFGGWGFSQTNAMRIFKLIGSVCANMIAFLAPANSIGGFIPIWLFGTDEQKKRYLPELASGKISAFALTEKNAGSDPLGVETIARKKYENGVFVGYDLTGEKLYPTGAVKDDNISLAEYLIVVARVVDGDSEKESKRKKVRGKLGLFFVDTRNQGYSTPLKCHFDPLRSITNGVVKLEKVFVSKEDLIGREGQGFKIAVQSLSLGRLTIASSCDGGLAQVLQLSRWHCKRREQFGGPIGGHEATGAQLVRIACLAFVTDALVKYCSLCVDQKKDTRIESMVTKILSTEHLWEACCLMMRIFGGQGCETYDSKKARGEVPTPTTRMWRDAWVNMIFEGENKVTGLYLVMESTHKYVKQALETDTQELLSGSETKATKAKVNYMTVIKQLVRLAIQSARASKKEQPTNPEQSDQRETHEDFIQNQGKELIQQLLLAGAKYQLTLQHKQLVIQQFGKRAFNLYMMGLALSYAAKHKDKPHAEELADYFCQTVREEMTGAPWTPDWILNGSHLKVGQLATWIMNGEMAWLEDGIISALEREGIQVAGWPLNQA